MVSKSRGQDGTAVEERKTERGGRTESLHPVGASVRDERVGQQDRHKQHDRLEVRKEQGEVLVHRPSDHHEEGDHSSRDLAS